MSVLNTLPAPVIQMGLVEKIVDTAQNQPHVQQLVAQEAALQALKAQGERIAGTEVLANSRKVRDREEGQGRQGRDPGRQRADDDASEDEAAQADTSPAQPSPWAGNIVNIKI